MKDVLTIDFDIVMYQDLQLYNDAINSNHPMDIMTEEFPLLQYVRFDSRFYQDLTNLLIGIFLNVDKDKIYFCANHEFITSLITEPVNIINIDHHHDIGY